MAAAPSCSFLPGPSRTRKDGFAREESSEFFGQGAGGRKPALGGFLEALQAQGLEIAWNTRVEQRERRGLGFLDEPGWR